jgi:flagellar biosynthesis/type III secretory pathway protein FliH
MTDKLRETISNVIDSAYSKGYEAGYKAAVKDFVQHYRDRANELEKSIKEAEEKENDNTPKDIH